MRTSIALIAAAAAATVASAQPGDRNAIVYGARAVGQTAWHLGEFSLYSPDSSPLTFEVGVFFFYDDGIGFATAVYKTYVDGVVNDGVTDTVTIVEDASNGVPTSGVDGRVGVFNNGVQTQRVFTNRGASVLGAGYRISSASDAADAGPAGGVAVKQDGPLGTPPFVQADGILGYRFNVTVAAPAVGGTRHFRIETPRNRVNGFAVFNPSGHEDAELLDDSLRLEGIALRASWVFCPSDISGDGFVDGLDSDLFNNAFETGDPSADYNADGFVDGLDSDLFMNDFESGC